MIASDPPLRVSLPAIALLFGKIGLTSFGGGVSGWIYREVVLRRGWLPEAEFLGGLTLAQVLPGPNVLNLSIHVGERLRGAAGSLTAVAALLLPPGALIVLLAAAFAQWGEVGWVHDGLEGVAAAAVGMTIATAVRSSRHALSAGRWPLPVIAGIFAAVGLLHWPLLAVVGAAAALGLFLAWRGSGR